MKLKRKRNLVRSTLWQMTQERKQSAIDDKMFRAFCNSTRLCGHVLDQRRPWLKHRCNKPTCPSCSQHWAKRLGKRYFAEYVSQDIHDYRLVTIMFDLKPTVEECLTQFRSDRERINKSIAKVRDTRKNPELVKLWKKMSMVGSLEIDLFYKDDFSKLGSKKQASYVSNFGFDAQSWIGENVYAPHVHAVAYLGSLPEDKLEKRLRKFSKDVHIKCLVEDKTLDQSVMDIVGHSVKTWFETTLDDNRKKEWRQQQIQEYVESLIRRQGRKSFRFKVSKYGMRKSKSQNGVM